jgi:hypothetical protein
MVTVRDVVQSGNETDVGFAERGAELVQAPAPSPVAATDTTTRAPALSVTVTVPPEKPLEGTAR